MDSLLSGTTNTRCDDNELSIVMKKHPSLQNLISPDITYTSEMLVDGGDAAMLKLSRYARQKSKVKRRKGKGIASEFTRRDSSVFKPPVPRGSMIGGKPINTFPDAQKYREKRRQLATSLASLSMKPDKRLKLVEDGAIKALMKLTLAEDDVVRRCCAITFAHLSTVPEIQKMLIEEGCLTSIVQLSSYNIPVIRGDCIKALCNLSTVVGNEHKIVKEGGASVAMQASHLTKYLKYSMIMLLNLSCVEDKYNRIEDVTDSILHIFEHEVDHFTEELDSLLLSILVNLSTVKQMQLRLVEDGAMKVVERNIYSDASNVRELVAKLLKNLSMEARTRIKLVDSGIIDILLQMSNDTSNVVRDAALITFHNLAKEVSCREKVVVAGAVKVVVQIATEDGITQDLARSCSGILRILCDDSSIIKYLMRDGLVKSLISLVVHEDSQVQQTIAEAMCALFSKEKFTQDLISLGCVSVLVQLSTEYISEVTAEWCAYALLSLCYGGVCPSEILSDAILPCVLTLCQSNGGELKTRIFCATALAELTRMPDISNTNTIKMLVYLLRNEKDEEVKTDCATALYNLAVSEANCEEMLGSGALLPIISLTKSHHLATKIRCAAILSRLTSYPEYHDILSKEDLRRLLNLSTIDALETQKRVVMTLSNLSVNVKLRNMLLEIEETNEAIKLLISKPDESIREGCSSIICNLCSAPGSEKEIVKAGMVPSLLVTALLATDRIETKLVCVKALLNLIMDESCRKSMINDGLIWGLSSLCLQAGKENYEIKRICAMCLANLSKDFGSEMLQSSVAVQTVMSLVVEREVIILQYGSRILLNMLKASSDDDEKFRCAAVEQMAIISSDHEEVSKLTILCLCLSSQSESCRNVIVRSGVLHSIDATTIFREAELSYAYLTMFGNIAQNASMREYLLDNKIVSKFEEISNTVQPYIHICLAKSMYYVTCCKSNIERFSRDTILHIIDSLVTHADNSIKLELLKYVTAIIYNFTTNTDTSNQFVLQGIMKTIKLLWKCNLEMLNADQCRLLILSICNLVCGSANSKLIIEGGAADILVFMIDVRSKGDKFYKFVYEDEDIECWSGAVRNILNVPPNHDAIVEAGVVEALVLVANEFLKKFHHLTDRSDDNLNRHNTSPKESEQAHRIFKNCTASLRSLTYNPAHRGRLDVSGAVEVIINYSKKEIDEQNLDIDVSLLHQIEAESWSNGIRSVLKDGRAKSTPLLPVFEEYLGQTAEPSFEYETVVDPFCKQVVKIVKRESSLDKDTATLPKPDYDEILPQMARLPKSEASTTLEELVSKISVSDDTMDNDIVKVCQEMESFEVNASDQSDSDSDGSLSDEDMYIDSPAHLAGPGAQIDIGFRSDNDMFNVSTFNSHNSNNNVPFSGIIGEGSGEITSSHVPFGGVKGTNDDRHLSIPSPASVSSPMNSPSGSQVPFSLPAINSPKATGGSNGNNFNTQRQLVNSGSMPSLQSPTGGNNETPFASPQSSDNSSNKKSPLGSATSNPNPNPSSGKKKHKTKTPTPNKEKQKQFDDLVSMINHSKRNKGKYIEEVAAGWKELSKC